MRVHVTGGSGFLGGHVIPVLLARGHDVTALARSTAAAERVADLGATAIAGDLSDPASIDAGFAASGAEALVNLASLGFGHAPSIVAAAEEAAISRAVFVSTTGIYTKLASRSKAMRLNAEETIKTSDLAWTILRPSMIYGTPSDRNMGRLLGLLQKVPVVVLPDGGRRMQQPVHVNDVAAVIAAVLEHPNSANRAYDIAGPEPLTLRQIVEEAGAAVGRSPTVVTVPLRPAVAVVRAYELVSSRPRLTAEQVERLAEDKVFDIEPARLDLAYDPRSFRQGINQEAGLLR